MTEQRVLVTAAASGIGREIALAFKNAGARVHAADINAEGLEQLEGITTSVTDVSDSAQVTQCVADAVEAMGGIDVLINCAGIAGPTAPFGDITPEQWNSVIGVNLLGTIVMTREVLPYLTQNETSSLIFISSLGGRFGYQNRAPYAVTKRGLIALTETLAIELGEQGVRVNAIAPGAVAGERIERVINGRAQAEGKSYEQAKAEMLGKQSLKYFTDPADIAQLCVFIASPAGKSISGATLPIDGNSASA